MSVEPLWTSSHLRLSLCCKRWCWDRGCCETSPGYGVRREANSVVTLGWVTIQRNMKRDRRPPPTLTISAYLSYILRKTWKYGQTPEDKHSSHFVGFQVDVSQVCAMTETMWLTFGLQKQVGSTSNKVKHLCQCCPWHGGCLLVVDSCC